MPPPFRPSLADTLQPPPSVGEPALWWRRRPSALVVALGVAGALTLAILIGLLLAPRPAVDRRAPAARPASPTEAVQRLAFDATAEPYRAPDDAAVREAYAEARDIFGRGGGSALARRGRACFESLAQSPGYRLLDYCIAFDLFANGLNTPASGGKEPSPTSWLGSAGARHLNVAQAVMGAEGDAEARVFDLRRAAALMMGAAPPPPLPAYGMQIIVDAPADLDLAAPRPAPPPQPPRAAPQPLPDQPPLARAQSAAPPPAPRAAPSAPPSPVAAPAPQRARAEPSAPADPRASPSFNCRYARTRSERLVCGDPALAAADRRLDRAFRDAVSAGQSASALRREQDRWLSRREQAADSPAAVAEVYERRIAELEALAGRR